MARCPRWAVAAVNPPPPSPSTPSAGNPVSGKLAYLAVIVAGFIVDFSVTMALSRLMSVPLEAAAVAGFLVALLLNYVLFEFWAFRANGSRFSGTRLVKTMASAGVALAVRISVIYALGRPLGDSAIEATLLYGAAVAASLAVNFVLLSNIFNRKN